MHRVSYNHYPFCAVRCGNVCTCIGRPRPPPPGKKPIVPAPPPPSVHEEPEMCHFQNGRIADESAYVKALEESLARAIAPFLPAHVNPNHAPSPHCTPPHPAPPHCTPPHPASPHEAPPQSPTPNSTPPHPTPPHPAPPYSCPARHFPASPLPRAAPPPWMHMQQTSWHTKPSDRLVRGASGNRVSWNTIGAMGGAGMQSTFYPLTSNSWFRPKNLRRPAGHP